MLKNDRYFYCQLSQDGPMKLFVFLQALHKKDNITLMISLFLDKIKLAFISEYLTSHTIGKLFKGIIFNLDPNKFDIILFHTHKT